MSCWCATLLFVVINQFSSGHGLSISQCQSSYITVDMDSSNNEITCMGIPTDQVVEWTYTGETVTSRTLKCDSSGNCDDNNVFTATRSGRSSSLRLTLNIKKSRTFYGVMTINCRTKQGSAITASTSCDLDVIHHAEVTSCTAQFNRPMGRQWTVSGSCDVSKAFSQRGRYSCQWTESRQGTNVDISSTVSVTDGATEGNITYKSMTCSFTKPFPSQTGNYNYAVVISPGVVRHSVTFHGSSQIELPSVLTTTCPTDYVREGDDVDCTCSVSSPGNPSGSVAWRDRQGSRLVLNDVGRTDHGKVYTCEVKWGLGVVRSTTFTLQVAYGPDTVITNGPKQPVDTDGTKDVTFTCTASVSQPAVKYQWRRLPTANTRTGNSYTVQDVSKDDDGAVFQCTAYNSKFPSVRAVSTVTLQVNYPPTDPPVIQSSSRHNYSLKGDPLTLTCVVRGGKPVSSISVTFNCPNKPDTDDVIRTTEVTSAVTFSPVAASNHGLVCTCSARWKSYDWYSLKTNFSLDVRYQAEVEALTVNNQNSAVTINETDTLSLNCTSRGRPTPRTVLLKDGTEVTSEPGGEVTVSDKTVVNVTSNASCESAGMYTCQANNDLGTHDHPAVNVFVNCAPRFSDEQVAPPYVNFIGKPVTVSITVTAYPAPTTFTLMFSEVNTGGEEPGTVSDVSHSIHCAQSDQPAAVTLCVLTINNATLSDRGIYNLSLKNQWGEAIFRFQLDSNITAAVMDKAQDPSVPISVAVGSAVGAVILFVLIILLVFLVIRQRKVRKESTRTTARLAGERQQEDADMTLNHVYNSPSYPDDEMSVNNTYERLGPGLPSRETDQANHYEELGISDGLPVFTSSSRDGPSSSGTETVDSSSCVYSTVDNEHKTEEDNFCRQNADGLVYSKIQFTEEQKKKAPIPSPAEIIDYAAINFADHRPKP